MAASRDGTPMIFTTAPKLAPTRQDCRKAILFGGQYVKLHCFVRKNSLAYGLVGLRHSIGLTDGIRSPGRSSRSSAVTNP